MRILLQSKQTGFTYFRYEFNFVFFPSRIFNDIKLFIHRKHIEYRQKVRRWYYGTYTRNGRGSFVWRDGCWIPIEMADMSLSRQVWHTYFDYGMGKFVDRSSMIRDHEREGYICTTHEEAEREGNKRREQIKKEYKAKIRNSVNESLVEVARGKKSYYREQLDRMPRDMRVLHERMGSGVHK